MLIHLRNQATGHYLGAARGAGPVFDSGTQAGPWEVFDLCDPQGRTLTGPLADGMLVTLQSRSAGTRLYWAAGGAGTTALTVAASSASPATRFVLRLRSRWNLPSSGPITHGSQVVLLTENLPALNNESLGLGSADATGRRTLRVNSGNPTATETFELWMSADVTTAIPEDAVVPMLRAARNNGKGTGTVTLTGGLTAPPGGVRVFLDSLPSVSGASAGFDQMDPECTVAAGQSSAPFAFQLATIQPLTTSLAKSTVAVRSVTWAQSELVGGVQNAFAAAPVSAPMTLDHDRDQCYIHLMPGFPLVNVGVGAITARLLTLRVNFNGSGREVLRGGFALSAVMPTGVVASIAPVVVPTAQGSWDTTVTLPPAAPNSFAITVRFSVTNPTPYHCHGVTRRNPLGRVVEVFWRLISRLIAGREATPEPTVTLSAVFLLVLRSDGNGYEVR